LYAKQGRHRQFKSQRERDNWIQKEVKELEQDMAKRREEVRKYEHEVLQLNEKKNSLSEDIQERTDQLTEHRELFTNMNKDRVEKKKKIDMLANERKVLWANERELEPKIQQLTEQTKSLRQQLRRTAPKSVFDGLDSVRKIAEEKRLSGVYGPLLEMFTCDERFEVATEVAAGSSIFNVIVDSLETAQRVATVMTANSSRYPGQMTCLPMTNMRPKQHTYPQSDDAIPLIEKLHFDKKLLGVMQHVFGSTLICRTLDVAVKEAKSGFNCVTLEGDNVEKRGAMSGGYHDKRQNRLRLQSNISAKQRELAEADEMLGEVKDKLNSIDAKMTKALQELSGQETKQARHRDEYEARKSELKEVSKEQTAITRELQEKEKMMMDVQSRMKANQSKIDSLSEEMFSDLQSQLTDSEKQMLVNLEIEIENCQSKLKACISNRAELEKKKRVYESLLEEDLNKRREQLQQMLESVSVEQQVRDIDIVKHENDHLETVVNDLKKQLVDVKSSEDNFAKKLTELSKQLERKKVS
jgi:structural maintenance of chromosome 3 (chondroitin sulfate proteoglycan 6)